MCIKANKLCEKNISFWLGSTEAHVGMGLFFSGLVLNEKNRCFKRKKQNLKKTAKKTVFFVLFVFFIFLIEKIIFLVKKTKIQSYNVN